MRRLVMFLALMILLHGLVSPVHADSAAINRLLGRGINMGNMLEAPVEGEWGPALDEKWNVLLREVLAIIRQANPNRTVLIGTAEWGGVGGFSSLKFPKNDKNLILTVHYYNPFRFTHQGAGWAGKESQSWLGTIWNGTYAEKMALRNELQAVKEFSDATGVPVHVGEFGAYSKGDLASRARWASYCAKLFEKLGFSWAYWEFCAGFGAYDPVKKAWREELANALISSDSSILETGQPPAHCSAMSNIAVDIPPPV